MLFGSLKVLCVCGDVESMDECDFLQYHIIERLQQLVSKILVFTLKCSWSKITTQTMIVEGIKGCADWAGIILSIISYVIVINRSQGL